MARNNKFIHVECIISCAGTPKNIVVLKKCIESLRNAAASTVRLSIVVTTNNSGHYIDQRALRIQDVIVSEKKSGFVGINNAAVKKTISQQSLYYLIINDDAWVDKNFFKGLCAAIRHHAPPPDVVIPLIYEGSTRTIDSFGVEYFRTGYSKNASSESVPTTLASMSCLFIRTAFLQKMVREYGYFLNPLLVWYLDDVDFSIRAHAIGARFIKNSRIIAHHFRTFTWGRKSPTVMYYSFRNLIWTVCTTWPKMVILKQLIRLLVWQNLVCVYCLIKYNPMMYPKIIWETMCNWNKLRQCRHQTLQTYRTSFRFESLFSLLEIRHDRITF